MQNTIRVKHLTKDFGNGRGIYDFNFEIKKGQIYGLVGTNGSGKTTTIRHMMGFLRSDNGYVTINGLDSYKHASKIKQYVGYCPGQIEFPDVGNGKNFLKIQAQLLGLKDLSYMNELIDRLKIDITAPLRRMSKGMKQKMALVVAFMAEPDIYILDEASTGLDPLMRDTLIEIILEQKAKGKTFFMSSHIFKELEDTCDKVMFIHDGEVVQVIDRAEYEKAPHELYIYSFAKTEDYKLYQKSEFYKNHPIQYPFEESNEKKNQISIYLPSNEIMDLLEELSKYELLSFSNPAITLENYYTNMIEKTGGIKND